MQDGEEWEGRKGPQVVSVWLQDGSRGAQKLRLQWAVKELHGEGGEFGVSSDGRKEVPKALEPW